MHERRRLGEAPRPRQPRHGHGLRGAGPPLQRGEQRGGRRALDAARRREAHGEADLPADRRPDRVGHLPALRRRLRHGRHAHRGRGDAPAARRRSTASRSPPTSTARRSTPRPTPSARPTCCSRARATRRTTSSAGRSTRRSRTTPSRRASSTSCSRNPPYGKSWKSDLERMGGKERHQGPALPHRARRRPGVLARHPLERRPDALPGQHALQDEARHEARQPHRRGAQRQLALHRRRRPGREQHPPLDHRERLARGHRRPAAQHVLQHRHRHLHLGAQQPQARAPQGQGAAHRRHAVVQAAAQEPGQEELRALRRGHRSASATPSSPSRRPSSRRSSPTPPSATGR